MSMNLNSVCLPEIPEGMDMAIRGLYYGDGLFETIRVFNGRVPFIQWHWERLEAGLRTLMFDVPEWWSALFFEREIQKIATGNARIRLTVWRSPGGLYLPSDNRPNFLLTAAPLEQATFEPLGEGLQLRLSKRVRLSVDALSGLKLLGSTRYVAAALEARSLQSDDVVLLNGSGMVCETSSSNILWIKKGIVFAPSPADGQVTGTCQKILSGVLRDNGFSIVEKPATFDTLMEAEEVMLTNSIQGIRWVRFLEGKEFRRENITHFNYLMVQHIQQFLM